jgi:hypothetical protein
MRFPDSHRFSVCRSTQLRLLIGLVIASFAASSGWGDAPEDGIPAQSIPAQGNPAQATPLTDRQESVAQRYQRLEVLLLRLADMETAENPDRAALLRRAAKMSRDKFVLDKLQQAGKAISSGQYKNAIDSQTLASAELDSILKLLQSEDRSKRIRDEKERYKKLIADLKRNLNNQRSARARAENGADLKEVQSQQESITKKSDEIRDRLNEEGEGEKEKLESKEPNSPDKEQEPSDKDSKPRDSKPSDSKPSDSKPSDSKPSDSKPSDSKPSDAKPSDSKPSDSGSEESSQPKPPQSPEQDVEQKLSEAIEKMKQAEEELKQSRREEATAKQNEAEERLRSAIDRLEKILRQLREEEMKRELARLESRVRKLAAMQTTVLEDTRALAVVPKAQRDRAVDLKAGKIAFEEKKITQEVDRALLVLREEGSSVAFPEIMSQIRGDTVRVGEMLAASQIDGLCQGLQEDILAALEEMIAALAKAQKDLEKKQQQAQEGQPPPSGEQEQPLVENLAELKLIRTMETRIQKTTNRYSEQLKLGDSKAEEIEPLLKDLSDRQLRLYRITRDLVMKRNQ